MDIKDATINIVHNFPEKLRDMQIIKCAETGVMFIRKDLFTSAVAEFLKSDTFAQSPNYPFASEPEWLNYNNQHTKLICDMIINWDGRGVSGYADLQKIKEVYRQARLLLRQ